MNQIPAARGWVKEQGRPSVSCLSRGELMDGLSSRGVYKSGRRRRDVGGSPPLHLSHPIVGEDGQGVTVAEVGERPSPPSTLYSAFNWQGKPPE